LRLFKPDAYIIVTTEDGKRIDLSQQDEKTGRRLDLSFFVEATKDSQPNSGECTIYNLTQDTKNAITAGAKIELFAGYDDNFKLVSIGDIKNVKNPSGATDQPTSIYWGDGIGSYLEAKFVKSFREGVSVADVFSELTSSFGLAVKSVTDELKGQLNGTLSIDGKSKDLLNGLTRDYGLEWSIQDDEVRVVVKGEPIDNEAIVISAATGLVGTPEVTNRGVNFEVQLNPDLRPSKLVRIEAASYVINAANNEVKNIRDDGGDGLYICETVRFLGDNHGGPFSAKVTAKRYDR
jgi:hypothetical protein